MQEEISFGVWLRKQRRALDLSRKAFADQIGCAQITLRRIEAGTLKPSKELAGVILEKLGIAETERSQWISFARGLSGFPLQSNPLSRKPITNLPASLTSFIGREKEQLDVIKLISKHRLVTLTGSGGVGKTRMAIKVGEQIAGDFPNSVWLVELASILDPLLVSRATAVAIGLREESKRPVIDMLSDYLREKNILIILDNCEHLLDACAQLVNTLLKCCHGLKILATSREALGILGEACYRVPSLELPDPEQPPEILRAYEAARLFEERAQLVQFDFSLTSENTAFVAQICQRLDGIPLALELAAAKISTFSAQQLAEQLDKSFNLLAGGGRAALARHQTLRASIDWSWNLLTEPEQRLMQQLSVFVGGWTLEAAQSVCYGDVLVLLNNLVTKSLIVVDQRAETNARYSFHETIRQYAREKLLETGGVEALRNKHLAYFVELVEQAEPELYRSNQVFWFKKLDDELDNFRVALEWAMVTDVESGLCIASIPWRFWDTRGYRQELSDWLLKLLQHHTIADALHAQALAVYSYCYFRQGNFAEAGKFAEHSLQLARTLANKQTEAFSLFILGLLHESVDEGASLLAQSLAIYRALGDKIGQANALEWLAVDSRPERARAFIKESLALYRELGNLNGIAVCLNLLSGTAVWSGDFSSPAPWLEEALSISRQLGNQTTEAYTLGLFGNLAYWQNNYQQANSYYREAISLIEKTGDHFHSLWAYISMAYTFLRQGDIQQARTLFADSVQNTHKAGLTGALVFAVEGIASLNINQAQPERAAQLLAWADTMRQKAGDPRPLMEQNSVERDLAVIHAKMDKSEFAKLSEEGRAMTVEQAVALALQPG